MNQASTKRPPAFSKGEFSFCPELSNLLQTDSTVGRSGKTFKELAALSTLNNLRVLQEMHLHFRPRRTLEIGLCFGGSCLLFTATHRELSGRPSRQHTAVDPYQTQAWDDAGLLAVERAGLSEYLDFRPQYSSVALPRLLENGEPFDLI